MFITLTEITVIYNRAAYTTKCTQSKVLLNIKHIKTVRPRGENTNILIGDDLITVKESYDDIREEIRRKS